MDCVSEVIFLEVQGFKIMTMIYTTMILKLYLLENFFLKRKETLQHSQTKGNSTTEFFSISLH